MSKFPVSLVLGDRLERLERSRAIERLERDPFLVSIRGSHIPRALIDALTRQFKLRKRNHSGPCAAAVPEIRFPSSYDGFLEKLSSPNHNPPVQGDCNGSVTCYRTIGINWNFGTLGTALALNGFNEPRTRSGGSNPSIGLRASSWNGWNWLFACVKVVSTDSKR